MGYYDDERPPPGEEERPGCLDTLLITRAVFSILFWPMLALLAVFVALGITFWLFTIHPALALIPLAVAAAALWAFARWDQQRHRPPGM